MIDALYARQSVEKAESISIESQLEACRYEARGRPSRTYTDRGYSGKDTHRPAFEALLADIRKGEIGRVIVYKLDRISRSILDFANMMDLFQSQGVAFVSSTERFDTATPIGRAMLHICIVFAQLERETIQKRVTDAYYARCRRGFYMGGRAPYGFAVQKTVMDGVHTACYIPVPEEAEQVRQLYALYADPAHSLGDLVRHCADHGLTHLRGGAWTTARLSELLRNPVYVRADAAVYEFFQQQGVTIANPVDDFIGYSGCYLYKGEAERARQSDLNGRELVLAPHEGLVSAGQWLLCRQRCLENRRSAQGGKGKSSWLCGKVKCGRCGHGLMVARSDSKWGRYFLCAHAAATRRTACSGTGCTLYADVLEEAMGQAICRQLSHFPCLRSPAADAASPQANELRMEAARVAATLEGLLERAMDAQGTVLAHLSRQADELAAQRTALLSKAEVIDRPTAAVVASPAQWWMETTIAEKQAVADALIERITVAEGKIDIFWRIS